MKEDENQQAVDSVDPHGKLLRRMQVVRTGVPSSRVYTFWRLSNRHSPNIIKMKMQQTFNMSLTENA